MAVLNHSVVESGKAVAIREIQRMRGSAGFDQGDAINLDENLRVRRRDGDYLRRDRDGKLGTVQVSGVSLAFGRGLFKVQGDWRLGVLHQPNQARAVVGAL